MTDTISERKKIPDTFFLLSQILFMLLWGAQLLDSDAYYVDYMILVIICFVSFFRNVRCRESIVCKEKNIRVKFIIIFFSALFTLLVAFANYSIWSYTFVPDGLGRIFRIGINAVKTIVFLAGGYIGFCNIFVFLYSSVNSLIWKGDKSFGTKTSSIFFGSFLLILLTRCILLFLCKFPGVLTSDSISQMKQIITGQYRNHHPFYHTQIIRCFTSLGMSLFGEINAAVATYSFFQMVFTSICFALCISTIALMKAPKWIVGLSMAYFTLAPYHIMYSITMTKDVIWGCCVLLFVIFSYRCISCIGNNILNLVFLGLSGLGVCQFRSNGLFSFVIVTVLCFVLWRRSNILPVLLMVIIVSFVMKHPVMSYLNVPQPDTIESLSIPTQQIARVVKDGRMLSEWEEEALGNIIDIERIPDEYDPGISDPIKKLVREEGQQELITKEWPTYLKLYFSLGIKYPFVFARAWIDETKGYWNAGYQHHVWYTDISDNPFGIERYIRSESLNRFLDEYLFCFTNIQLLKVLISIGVCIWLFLVMLFVALIRKDKTGIFVVIPVLAIVISLLISTPVYSDFRYIYAAFCSLPMVMVIVLRPINDYQIDTV